MESQVSSPTHVSKPQESIKHGLYLLKSNLDHIMQKIIKTCVERWI